jgi:hypothetical protein
LRELGFLFQANRECAHDVTTVAAVYDRRQAFRHELRELSRIETDLSEADLNRRQRRQQRMEFETFLSFVCFCEKSLVPCGGPTSPLQMRSPRLN